MRLVALFLLLMFVGPLAGSSVIAGLVAQGAEAVILGGAALAGLAARIQPAVPAPVLCSVEAGTRAVLAAAAGARAGRQAEAPPLASLGLSPALTALLAGD